VFNYYKQSTVDEASVDDSQSYDDVADADEPSSDGDDVDCSDS